MNDSECPVSRTTLWAGRILSAIPALFLIFSGTLKLIGGEMVKKGFDEIGWPVGLAVPLGVVEIACSVIYLVPPTAVLGAILMTGFMGGAIAAHVRVGQPFLVQFAVGVVVWLGLFLRDARLRALLPFRRL